MHFNNSSYERLKTAFDTVMAKPTLCSYKPLTQGKISQQNLSRAFVYPQHVQNCPVMLVLPAALLLLPKLTILPKSTMLLSTLDGKLALI